MKFGSHTCQFGTFTKGNVKAKFCSEFSKYIEAVRKNFLTQTIFAWQSKISGFLLNLHLFTFETKIEMKVMFKTKVTTCSVICAHF